MPALSECASRSPGCSLRSHARIIFLCRPKPKARGTMFEPLSFIQGKGTPASPKRETPRLRKAYQRQGSEPRHGRGGFFLGLAGIRTRRLSEAPTSTEPEDIGTHPPVGILNPKPKTLSPKPHVACINLNVQLPFWHEFPTLLGLQYGSFRVQGAPSLDSNKRILTLRVPKLDP